VMAEMAACLDGLKVWQQNWLSAGSGLVAKIAKVQGCATTLPTPGPGSAERTNVAAEWDRKPHLHFQPQETEIAFRRTSPHQAMQVQSPTP
jgi:hypothetical protein